MAHIIDIEGARVSALGKVWVHKNSVWCETCRVIFAGKYPGSLDPDTCVCGTRLRVEDLTTARVISKSG